MKSILQDYGRFQPDTIWLRHIISVRPGSDGRWLGAPALELAVDSDDVEALHVTRTGLLILNGDPRNRGERDAMVAVLQRLSPTRTPPTFRTAHEMDRVTRESRRT